MKTSVGIDISKKTFNCCILIKESKTNFQFENSLDGFKQLLLVLDSIKSKDNLIITMENTGTYHLKLATFLYDKGFNVSVVNPLTIFNYIKMKMIRVKTDKKDAQIIAEYGIDQPPSLFKPNSLSTYELKYILHGIDDLKKVKTQLTNQLEALSCLPVHIDSINNLWNEQIQIVKGMIKKLEKQLQSFIDNNYPDTSKRLLSIPGIGTRLTAIFIAYFGNFETFENSNKVSAFIGINPSPYESGTSIKKSGKISKCGNRYIRTMIFMAAMVASNVNTPCKELHDRLKAKGKPGKLIIIAVANKLLRQVFAIVKYKRYYDPDFISVKPINNIA